MFNIYVLYLALPVGTTPETTTTINHGWAPFTQLSVQDAIQAVVGLGAGAMILAIVALIIAIVAVALHCKKRLNPSKSAVRFRSWN